MTDAADIIAAVNAISPISPWEKTRERIERQRACFKAYVEKTTDSPKMDQGLFASVFGATERARLEAIKTAKAAATPEAATPAAPTQPEAVQPARVPEAPVARPGEHAVPMTREYARELRTWDRGLERRLGLEED